MATTSIEHRMQPFHIIFASLIAMLLGALPLEASTLTFDNALGFFSAVGSTTAYRVSSLPSNAGFAAVPFRFVDGAYPFMGGDSAFEIDESPSAFNALSLGDFSPRYPGNELAVAGVEDILALSQGVCVGATCTPAPVFFSIGFNIVEPRVDGGSAAGPDGGSPFVDSLFLVTLIGPSNNVITSFTFNPPDDTAAFIGAWSSEPIRQVRIRELTDDPGDEFFGDFAIGTQPLAVPEPSAIALLAAGIFGLLRRHRGDR
jgi:hypothetical protein